MSSNLFLERGVQLPYIFHEKQTPCSDSANLEPSEPVFCPQILEPRFIHIPPPLCSIASTTRGRLAASLVLARAATTSPTARQLCRRSGLAMAAAWCRRCSRCHRSTAASYPTAKRTARRVPAAGQDTKLGWRSILAVARVWAPEFKGRIGFPPPEKNELVLSIETGCTDTVHFNQNEAPRSDSANLEP